MDLFKININDLFVNLIRNIPRNDLINNITYQPCRLLTQYLLCRIKYYKDPNIINEKYTLDNLNKSYFIPGYQSTVSNNYWFYPIYHKNISKIINRLDEKDIHFVKKISQLICVDSKCLNSQNIINNIIFLPIHSKTNINYTKYITNKLNNAIN